MPVFLNLKLIHSSSFYNTNKKISVPMFSVFHTVCLTVLPDVFSIPEEPKKPVPEKRALPKVTKIEELPAAKGK